MDGAALWIPATLIACVAQVLRNTLQRRLTDTIGTVGAAQVRFLYGLPFALLFLAVVLAATGERLPAANPRFLLFVAAGAVAQVAATVLMLAAMRARSFAVVTALMKTEPVQIAVFGFAVLGDRLSPAALAGIVVATAGVVLMSWRPKVEAAARAGTGIGAVPLGLAAGALFAISAIGFRGATVALETGGAVPRASTALAWSLALQTAMLLAWLSTMDRAALLGSFREWRSSIAAGFVGALASQFWFIGFAVTAAANVRTLALVEVLLAQAVSSRVLRQRTSVREVAGLVLIVGGVGALLVGST